MASRFGMDDMRHGHAGSHEVEQVDLLLTQRRIMLVDPQHQQFRNAVDRQLEVGVPHAVEERVDVQHPRPGMGQTNHPVDIL